MKIAIFGTGVVGQTIAEKLVSLGHEVHIGTRDVENTLKSDKPDQYGRPPFKEWIKQNHTVKLLTFRDAAKNGDLIINATNGKGTLDALRAAGKENLKGKLLIDISNPLDFSKGMPPSLTVCNTDSLGETIQREFPDVKVVKALNTLNAFIMVNPSLLPGEHNVFICGNDEEAKKKVVDLLTKFGWKEENLIDIGDITASRGAEMLLPMWVRLLGKFQSAMFNFSIVR